MLPGGLPRAGGSGEVRRDYVFAPLTGEVELALSEAARGAGSLPERVTRALVAALAELRGEPAGPEMVRALSVADRQYLMRRLGAALGPEEIWRTAVCKGCGEAFDVPVRPADLPVKPAGEGYPVAALASGALFHVPTGADQEAIAGIADAGEARRELARRCRMAPAAKDLTEGDLVRLEEALERVSPELPARVGAVCPECGAIGEVFVDPYLCLDAAAGEDLFDEVHEVASFYHWSEREILMLPRERRHLYLRRIERARGVAG